MGILIRDGVIYSGSSNNASNVNCIDPASGANINVQGALNALNTKIDSKQVNLDGEINWNGGGSNENIISEDKINNALAQVVKKENIIKANGNGNVGDNQILSKLALENKLNLSSAEKLLVSPDDDQANININNIYRTGKYLFTKKPQGTLPINTSSFILESITNFDEIMAAGSVTNRLQYFINSDGKIWERMTLGGSSAWTTWKPLFYEEPEYKYLTQSNIYVPANSTLQILLIISGQSFAESHYFVNNTIKSLPFAGSIYKDYTNNFTVSNDTATTGTGFFGKSNDVAARAVVGSNIYYFTGFALLKNGYALSNTTDTTSASYFYPYNYIDNSSTALFSYDTTNKPAKYFQIKNAGSSLTNHYSGETKVDLKLGLNGYYGQVSETIPPTIFRADGTKAFTADNIFIVAPLVLSNLTSTGRVMRIPVFAKFYN